MPLVTFFTGLSNQNIKQTDTCPKKSIQAKAASQWFEVQLSHTSLLISSNEYYYLKPKVWNYYNKNKLNILNAI